MCFSFFCYKKSQFISSIINVCMCVFSFLPIYICSVASMAQYYQIQNIDELKQIYADVQVVHVASDDVGVSNPNRAQVHSYNITNHIYLSSLFLF